MKVVQVILALSTLILVHELGHFFFAKLFKIKVDKFYLFFDTANFKLLSTKNNKFLHKLFPKLKDSETDYGIGWLPLGGYCKICGMIDESMDTEAMKQDPQPWEFRTKPAWQRLLVMAGGVLFNFILAICLYIGILAGWGESFIENKGTQIYVNELSHEMGFRTGDEILSFDEYIPERFTNLQADLIRQNSTKATILRDGDTVSLYIDQSLFSEILKSPRMFDIAIPFIVDTIPPSSPNHLSPLKKGDRLIEIAGKEIRYVQDSQKLLLEHMNTNVPVKIIRGEDSLDIELAVDSLGHFGIYTQYPKIQTKDYNIGQAIPAGFKLTFSTIGDYLKDLKMVANPSTEAYKSVGSFISIGQIFPNSWNWYQFINILALLSIMLGVMNLLPIPALDGGHILFTLYEMISGRKPSDKFLMVTQIIGMFIIFAIMILAFGNDISRLIK